MNAPQPLDLRTAPLGTALAGGILVGRFFLEVQPFALIAATKHEGEFPATVWNKSVKKVEGALSSWDGLANTSAMAEAGSALAKKILGLKIGGVDDWYLPSQGEAFVAAMARHAVPADEAFERSWYWTSTQCAEGSSYAWGQSFGLGYQYGWRKGDKGMARAVRRVTL